MNKQILAAYMNSVLNNKVRWWQWWRNFMDDILSGWHDNRAGLSLVMLDHSFLLLRSWRPCFSSEGTWRSILLPSPNKNLFSQHFSEMVHHGYKHLSVCIYLYLYMKYLWLPTYLEGFQYLLFYVINTRILNYCTT